MTWLSNYNYRKKIPVSSRVEGSLSDHPTLLTINSGNGVDSPGMVYLCNSSSNWPYDIRITEADGVKGVNYYFEQSGNNWSGAKCWIKLPSISNTIDKDYYIYYGNYSASDVGSNGSNIFPDYFEHWIVYNDYPNWTKRNTGNNYWYSHDNVSSNDKYKSLRIVGDIDTYNYGSWDYSFIGFQSSRTSVWSACSDAIMIEFWHRTPSVPDTTNIWTSLYVRSGSNTYTNNQSGCSLSNTADKNLEIQLNHSKDRIEYFIKFVSSNTKLIEGTILTNIPNSSNIPYLVWGGLDVAGLDYIFYGNSICSINNLPFVGGMKLDIDQWFISDYAYPEPIWKTPGVQQSYSISDCQNDLRIFFKPFTSADNICCRCSRWDISNYSFTIETWLTKTQLQTLREHIRPGATGEFYSILSNQVYYDQSWSADNTLMFSPNPNHQSNLKNMKQDSLGYVKNITTHPINKDWIEVKIECFRSGSQRL